jgi:hypothetical protein
MSILTVKPDADLKNVARHIAKAYMLGYMESIDHGDNPFAKQKLSAAPWPQKECLDEVKAALAALVTEDGEGRPLSETTVGKRTPALLRHMVTADLGSALADLAARNEGQPYNTGLITSALIHAVNVLSYRP